MINDDYFVDVGFALFAKMLNIVFLHEQKQEFLLLLLFLNFLEILKNMIFFTNKIIRTHILKETRNFENFSFLI